MSHRHESGPLRQNNKAHKSRWRTKGQQLDRVAGRTISTKVSHHKKKGSQSKAARKHKSNQVREAKRQAAMETKRRIGTPNAPPLYLLFVHLQEDTPAAVEVRDQLMQAAVPKHVHTDGSAASEGADNAASDAMHAWTPDFHDVSFYSTRLKKKIAMAVAPSNVHATLELAKVADAVLFVGRPYEDVSEDRQLFISCLCAQGVPTTVHILTDLAGMPQKKRSEAKRLFTKEALEVFPEGAVQYVEKPSDYQTCLWGAVNKKRRVVKWREARSHIMADHVEYDASSRELRVTGYARGPALDVNSLVYLPGLGARQIARVLRAAEPISPDHRKRQAQQSSHSAPGDVVAQPNPELQHSLQSEVEVDPLDAEQTFPTDEELAQAEGMQQRAMAVRTQKVRVPKGFSDYQAVWMIGGSDDEDDDDNETDQRSSSMMLGGDDEDADMDRVQRDIWESVKKSDYVGGIAASDTNSVNMQADDEDDDDGDGEDDDMEDREFILDPQARAKAYDAAMDMTEEHQDLEKLRAAKEDREFPDEVDTPLKQPARVRFGKYRGLQSFRHTPWDPKEDLPPQYARIFKFSNFDHTRRRILKQLSAKQTDEEMAPYLVSEGSYVTVCVADVPETFPQTVDTNMPLVLWALVEHENKMSVAHFLVKMHPTHNTPIKSKERLEFSTGVRRFYAEPIFSSNTSGNKHKFERYLQPGTVAIATTICPVIFPPMPVLCFKEMEDGSKLLVATGTAAHVNPDRVVVKRIRLSGPPYKIHKRSAVIRHMFFDPDDIHWFKPVELVTKLGRRGHIKESLGTHGHMKCTFDKQLKPHDTVLMNLYKRVYPKWKFEEARPTAVDTLTLTPLTAEGEEEMDDDGGMAQDDSGDEMQA